MSFLRQQTKRRARLGLAVIAAGALLLAVVGCGRDDHENLPREPVPVELTAAVTDRAVDISPAEVGAGIVVITIANVSGDTVSLTLSGPTDDASYEIPPGGNGNFRTQLREGTYEVTAGVNARPRADRLVVGPPRPAGQNELLLP